MIQLNFNQNFVADFLLLIKLSPKMRVIKNLEMIWNIQIAHSIHL